VKWRKKDTPGPSETDEQILARAFRRADKMSTTDLLNWADVAGSSMAKGFLDYREHGGLESITDLGLGLIALQAVIYVLKARCESELGIDS
jgi:hypothetical protein